MLPISWLSLSRGKRLLIVTLSYILGEAGLWVLFPLVHNGATMFLPIISACWLFYYRGLVVSLVLNGIAFQITYYLLLRGMLPDQAFIEGGIIGFGTSLGLGLVVCWLRTAVELVRAAHQRTLAAEHERLLAQQAEHHVTLAYEQQCKVNDIKDQFLLNVSHELRTPLTELGGFLEMLKEYFELLAPEERARLLAQALESHQDLVSLVNRVLESISVAEELPPPQCEAVSLHQLVQEVITHFDPRNVSSYTIHLQIPEQIMVWADPQYLRQVLRNLLSNIFKYVPAQTEIGIEAAQASSSSPVYITVRDMGPGIPPEEIALLFERFARLRRDLAGSTRGTGLGLYICKRLVEAMRGHIWVESTGCPGEGCRFYFTLPSPASLLFTASTEAAQA
jgi:signal transduction histidine kinase